MTRSPKVDRGPVQLPMLPGHDDEQWAALIELSNLRSGEWTLIGAIVGKAVAVEVDDVPDAQLLDLALLLSLVDNPLELAEQLTNKDRQRLRARAEMTARDHPAWADLPDDRADRGRAVYRLLVR